MRKNVPVVRFNGFDDVWGGARFGDIYERSVEKNTEGIGVNKTISVASMTYKPEGNGAAKEALSAYWVSRIGDISFEGNKSKYFSYGRFVLNDIGVGIVSPIFETFRPIINMPISFWKYYINSEKVMRKVLINTTKSGVMMHKVVATEFLEKSIPIPSHEEQEAIGKLLSEIDKECVFAEKKYKQLKQLKVAYLEKLFPRAGEKEPQMRLKGFDGRWKDACFGDITTSYSGGTPVVENKAYYDRGTIPFIRSGEIKEDRTELFINELGLKNSSAKLVKKGMILYALYGATSGEVGRSKIDGAINQAILAITPNEDYDAEFVAQWLVKEKHAIINTYLQGGQGNLSAELVKALTITAPSLEEQTAIGNFFKELDNLITLQKKKCEKLKQIKQFYLDKMFV